MPETERKSEHERGARGVGDLRHPDRLSRHSVSKYWILQYKFSGYTILRLARSAINTCVPASVGSPSWIRAAFAANVTVGTAKGEFGFF